MKTWFVPALEIFSTALLIKCNINLTDNVSRLKILFRKKCEKVECVFLSAQLICMCLEMIFVFVKQNHEWAPKEMGNSCIYWSKYNPRPQALFSSRPTKKAGEADKANNSTHSFEIKYT